MTHDPKLDQYLPEGYEPHSRPLSELYAEAMKELALPFPSVKTQEFFKLDQMTGGLRAREFTILCGATGVGKTALLANLAVCFVKQKEPIFVASVETGPTDFIKRMISILEKKDLNHGEKIELDTLKKIHTLHGGLLQTDYLSLSLYDNRFSVETLMAELLWHVKNKGTKIAMIDNLNFFMEIKNAGDQIVEMDRVIHELIIFCKRVDLHLIMVMHPKKTDHGRVESEFDIKGSSTAVQEAHNIFLFNRCLQKVIDSGIADPNSRELKIAKMRRRGKFINRALILKCLDGVSYFEGEMI